MNVTLGPQQGARTGFSAARSRRSGIRATSAHEVLRGKARRHQLGSAWGVERQAAYVELAMAQAEARSGRPGQRHAWQDEENTLEFVPRDLSPARKTVVFDGEAPEGRRKTATAIRATSLDSPRLAGCSVAVSWPRWWLQGLQGPPPASLQAHRLACHPTMWPRTGTRSLLPEAARRAPRAWG